MVILCKLKSGPQTILQLSAICLKASFVNDPVMYELCSWVIKKEYEGLIIIHWESQEIVVKELMVLFFGIQAPKLLLIELLLELEIML